jgi:hypothetical protein
MNINDYIFQVITKINSGIEDANRRICETNRHIRFGPPQEIEMDIRCYLRNGQLLVVNQNDPDIPKESFLTIKIKVS